MKYLRLSLPVLFVISFFCSCDFAGNILKYRTTSFEFADHLVKQEYDSCISLMAMDHELGKETNVDTLKSRFNYLSTLLVRSFGNKLNYTFVSGNKTYSTIKSEKTVPHSTNVIIQFDNAREFGMMQFLFDDISGKILNIKILDFKQPIPTTGELSPYGLFCLLAVLVVSFNIYVIIKVKRSQAIKKWKKYLVIIAFNFPVLGYNVITGFYFKVLTFLFMGLSFSAMGYAGTACSFGLPLGGLYVFWKLYNGLYVTREDVERLHKLQQAALEPVNPPDPESTTGSDNEPMQ